MAIDWKSYWDKHVNQVSDAEPFRQVMRVQNKEPISETHFTEITDYIIDKLELADNQKVLDFCCGNGLVSAAMSPHCREIIGVDFSERLVENIKQLNLPNVQAMVGEALETDFDSAAFDRILFAAALQHFTQAQVVELLSRLYKWLKPAGRLLITDIPDFEHIWNFYNSPEREEIYFRNLRDETPVIGAWFDRLWLEKLARISGFDEVHALDQPENFVYSHYRFDLLCVKNR